MKPIDPWDKFLGKDRKLTDKKLNKNTVVDFRILRDSRRNLRSCWVGKLIKSIRPLRNFKELLTKLDLKTLQI